MRNEVFLPVNLYNTPIVGTPIVQTFNVDEEVIRLMGEGYDITNMRQLGFPNLANISSYLANANVEDETIDNLVETYDPDPDPDNIINYNCIGWAFDVERFIEPELENRQLVTRGELSNFIVECFTAYEELFPQAGVVDRWFIPTQENATYLQDYRPNYNFQEDDVVFYFGTNEDTELLTERDVLLHAARYFDVSRHEGALDLRWTSKMGDMLLVSHNLVDLVGDTYGNITDMLVGS